MERVQPDHNHRFTFLAAAARLRSLSDRRFCPRVAGSAVGMRLLVSLSFGASVAARKGGFSMATRF
jgi:hypothetical protein